MKQILLSTLALSVALSSCSQLQKMPEPTFYKPLNAGRSIAVPVSSSTVGVVFQGANRGATVTNSPFLEALKSELRASGWKLVVQGVTGRSGETNSINSGAAYTLICGEASGVSLKSLSIICLVGLPAWILQGCPPISPACTVNCVLVENRTGEEVMVIRGYADDSQGFAKYVAQRIKEKCGTGRRD